MPKEKIAKSFARRKFSMCGLSISIHAMSLCGEVNGFSPHEPFIQSLASSDETFLRGRPSRSFNMVY